MFTLLYRFWLGVKPGDSRYELVPTPVERAMQIALVAFIAIGGPIVAAMELSRGDWTGAVGMLVLSAGAVWLFTTAKEHVWLGKQRVSAPGRPAFLVSYKDITHVNREEAGGVFIAGRAKRLWWTAPDTRLFRVRDEAQFLHELRQRIDEAAAESAPVVPDS